MMEGLQWVPRLGEGRASKVRVFLALCIWSICAFFPRSQRSALCVLQTCHVSKINL